MAKANRMAWTRWLVAVVIAGLVAIGSMCPTASIALASQPAEDPYADAVEVPWDDGDYLVSVTLEGGSGRSSVSSPTAVHVEDGKVAATITWSSPHYDYMVVAGRTYVPLNEEGNSVFVIPVLAFDEPFDVIADTTAMSQPHEIDYTLTFDSESARAQQARDGFDVRTVVFAAVCVGALAGVFAARNKHAARA